MNTKRLSMCTSLFVGFLLCANGFGDEAEDQNLYPDAYTAVAQEYLLLEQDKLNALLKQHESEIGIWELILEPSSKDREAAEDLENLKFGRSVKESAAVGTGGVGGFYLGRQKIFSSPAPKFKTGERVPFQAMARKMEELATMLTSGELVSGKSAQDLIDQEAARNVIKAKIVKLTLKRREFIMSSSVEEILEAIRGNKNSPLYSFVDGLIEQRKYENVVTQVVDDTGMGANASTSTSKLKTIVWKGTGTENTIEDIQRSWNEIIKQLRKFAAGGEAIPTTNPLGPPALHELLIKLARYFDQANAREIGLNHQFYNSQNVAREGLETLAQKSGMTPSKIVHALGDRIHANRTYVRVFKALGVAFESSAARVAARATAGAVRKAPRRGIPTKTDLIAIAGGAIVGGVVGRAFSGEISLIDESGDGIVLWDAPNGEFNKTYIEILINSLKGKCPQGVTCEWGVAVHPHVVEEAVSRFASLDGME